MRSYFFFFLLLFLFPLVLFPSSGNCHMTGIPEYVQLDNEARKSLGEYAKQLGKEEGFEVLSVGTTAVVEGKGEGSWCLNIIYRKPQTLEESRTYTLKLLNQLYTHMRNTPLYGKAIAAMYKQFGNPTRPYYQPELTTHQFALKLSYWDVNFDRFPKPSVSQVRVINNKLYFYYANASTQALEEPPIEEIWANTEKPWQ
jgi:hypothetical protein